MTEKWTIDTELGEVLQDNEAQLAEQIAAVNSAGIHLRDQGGRRMALRNVHPRAHGCVRAECGVDAGWLADVPRAVKGLS